jgi:hypothetical protein
MRKKLTLLAATMMMAMGMVFATSFASTGVDASDQSCQGRCNRSKNACLATARTTAEAARCNQAYQGCISSCH